MAHGHDTPATPASPAVRRTVIAILVPFVLATIAGIVLLWPSGGEQPSLPAPDRVDATILDIKKCPDQEENPECRQAVVELESGEEAVVPLPFGAGAPAFAKGDEVVLGHNQGNYEFLDFQRSVPLFALGIAFALAVVVLSRWRGLAALAGLGFSALVLTFFILPSLLEGSSPLAVAIVGAAAIMIGTLYLSHGLSVRTSIALIGTLISLTLTGVLGYFVIDIGSFAGLSTESSGFLASVADQLDFRGLLLAGLVIGALGVLDDVTVTQTAAVWELAAADPNARRRDLFAAGLRIGREHVAATVNTLVLAYAGAALPLLMLLVISDQTVGSMLTSETVAQEVVRALAGSLGIVAAVPVTTALAAMAVRQGSTQPRARRGRRARRPQQETDEVDAWLG